MLLFLPTISLSVVSVVNLVWESLPKYRADPSESFFIVDSVCVSYFTLDLALRLVSPFFPFFKFELKLKPQLARTVAN